jgi:hypothetical protein
VTNGGDGVGLYLGGGIVAPLAGLALGIPLERHLFAHALKTRAGGEFIRSPVRTGDRVNKR